MRTFLASTLALATLASPLLAGEPATLTSRQMAQARVLDARAAMAARSPVAEPATLAFRPTPPSAFDDATLRGPLVAQPDPGLRPARPPIRLGATGGRVTPAAVLGPRLANGPSVPRLTRRQLHRMWTDRGDHRPASSSPRAAAPILWSPGRARP